MMFERKKDIRLMRDYYKEQYYELLRKNAELERKLKGDRVCDRYCEKCVHSVMKSGYISENITYICTLECKCKDFENRLLNWERMFDDKGE